MEAQETKRELEGEMNKEEETEWVFEDEDGESDAEGDEQAWMFLNEWASALQAVQPEKEEENTPFLSEEEIKRLSIHPHRFLSKNGYLVAKNVIPKETCARMAAEIYDRAYRLCDLDQSNPATWEPVLEDNGFLDIWHGSTYYEIRQIPQVYSIWAQLLRNHDLTLGMDRVSLKPPAYVDVEGELSLPKKFIDRVEALEGGKNRVWFKQPDFRIHNDMNMWDLKECKYQGGIALQDCPKGAGGFRCIPGYHKLDKLRRYRERYEYGEFHRSGPQPPPKGSFIWFLDEDAIKKETVEVEMSAGDVVIWNSRLPHSSCINATPNWRVHCFVRFMPSELHATYRAEVQESVLTGHKPKHYSTGDNLTEDKNRKWEEILHQVPELTWLGRRVLGLEEFVKEEQKKPTDPQKKEEEDPTQEEEEN